MTPPPVAPTRARVGWLLLLAVNFAVHVNGFATRLIGAEGEATSASVATGPATTNAVRPDRALTAAELAAWIDQQFESIWSDSHIDPPALVDDATFLKRAYLDLSGTIAPVSEAREFLNYEGEHKRFLLVEKLLTETRRPEKHAERTAAHWASLWRRMMVPGNTPQARTAVALEPWLKEQFQDNVPYDEMVRALLTAGNQTTATPAAGIAGGMAGSSGPLVFYSSVGGTPQSVASSVSRVFLGVRIGCAECHDHPFAAWKQRDFWGMAAFFAGVSGASVNDASPARIRPENSLVEYTAAFLGNERATIPANQSPRDVLANWIVSDSNTLFAATAVNRIWMYLMGRPMTDSVDDLDLASPDERRVLDQLAQHFVAADYDVRWLIQGIMLSRTYQRGASPLADASTGPLPGLRPVKSLTPEQLFNSLEQALALPVARADNGARYNGLRDQLIARMDEAASNQPDEYRAGVPQALMMMNGRLTTDATDLELSRTLRGVVDAPFLSRDEKIDALFLAALNRLPKPDERQFLLTHLSTQSGSDAEGQAFADVFWGLLNSPEIVLER